MEHEGVPGAVGASSPLGQTRADAPASDYSPHLGRVCAILRVGFMC